MEEFESRRNSSCPLCGAYGSTIWRFELLRCDACNLVFSPSIWRQGFNEEVNDQWFGEEYERRGASIWVGCFEAISNRRTLSRLLRLPTRGKRLLEIGVGSGSFLAAARGAGFEVMGCDLSAAVCRRVSQSQGVLMHCGPLDTMPKGAHFDVIVMNHVLEHVQNPVAFLRDVDHLLAANGVVHIAVPNVACWEACLSGWINYEPYHLTYFDEMTLRRAIGDAGLEATYIANHESFSGWFLAALRTAVGVNRAGGATTRYARVASGVTEARGRPAVIEHAYRVAMSLVGFGLWPLRRLQVLLRRGDELICVACSSRSVVDR
jgi:2-polyprenyl-3-methyl-5-hydroxy-6-metoxy-1,4-benzoquinol methylase